MKREIILTKDGSATIYLPEIDEHYHSFHGAIQEAVHVFINNGLLEVKGNKINILEVGFGTGLNALLTLINKQDKEISYYALETEPVEFELISKLNYLELLNAQSYSKSFELMHICDWNKKLLIEEEFYLDKLLYSLQEIELKKKFDLVYYDAFGPRAQKEMWEKALFQKIYDSMNEGGVLVTYCAMGQFKRDLKSIGFTVETLAGPPGKREMIRTIKN